MKSRNKVKRIREAEMLGKTELARLAGVSPLTIDRIERGLPCRVVTQRQIILALGLKFRKGEPFSETTQPSALKMDRAATSFFTTPLAGVRGTK
jgi:DNA-binding XRE family transcriptional regulator